MTSDMEIIKIKVHDGIIGLLYLGSIVLAQKFNIDWINVAAGVAFLKIISPITKFCPVYTILNKLIFYTKRYKMEANSIIYHK